MPLRLMRSISMQLFIIYMIVVVLVAFAVVPTSPCGNGIQAPVSNAPAMAGTILAPGQSEIGYNP
jgi:hypothetical protein